MDKRFDIPRGIRRMAPKHAATAAVFQDAHQLAYGVIRNVSATGACIVTDSRLPPGSDVNIKLSFFKEPELYEVSARVVWHRKGGAAEKGFAGLQLHGVQFTASSAIEKSRFHELLASEDFEDVYRPSSSEFEVMQSALSEELAELGTKITDTTGIRETAGEEP